MLTFSSDLQPKVEVKKLGPVTDLIPQSPGLSRSPSDRLRRLLAPRKPAVIKTPSPVRVVKTPPNTKTFAIAEVRALVPKLDEKAFAALRS